MNDAQTRINEFLNQGQELVSSVADAGRVAARLLPKYQLAPTAKQVVADHVLHNAAGEVDDVATIPLAEIWLRIAIDWQQLSEPSLRTALGLLRTGTQRYNRLEDRLLFLGQSNPAAGPPGPPFLLNPASQPLPPEQRVDRGSENNGLLDVPFIRGYLNSVYDSVRAAHDRLTGNGIAGPFGIVMGAELADQADRTQAGFHESARKRIETLLGTEVLRSTVLADRTAILLGGAQAGNAQPSDLGVPPSGPVDRAVALEPELRFLGNTDNQGRYEFWIVGGLALRLKDSWGVIKILFV